MALGNVARARNVVHLNLPLHEEATEAHTVQGLKHNLLSVNRLTKSGYTAEFNGDRVSFFNAHGDRRVTPRTSVLHGWYVPDEGLWRIPLRSKQQVVNKNKDTYLSKCSPLKILGDSKQPPIDKICSVYEIKVQLEIVRY